LLIPSASARPYHLDAVAPVDPALAELLARTDGATPEEFRPRERRMLYRSLHQYAAGLVDQVEVGSVEEIEVDGGDGPVRARVYRPKERGPRPTLVFFHGGGFVIGDLEGYDFQCRTLCRETGAVVLAVDYRLAPEAPFPAAVEDAVGATRWAALNVPALGGDPHRLAVGGDSAGGCLTAVVCQQARESGPRVVAQLLLYPVTDFQSTFASHAAHGEGKLLTRQDMAWFHSMYLTDDSLNGDSRVSPALAGDLAGLPPAVVATAEYDPLVDDGDAYAEKLLKAGNRVVHRRFEGLIHGFFALGPVSPACAEATRVVCADLRGLLEGVNGTEAAA
jgi:acetyl esterase